MAAEEPPKYRRIAGEWRDRIRSGGIAPGTQLPSKADMMASYKVSLGTVNDALKVLRDEGLVESRQGSGTFVVDKLPEEARSEFDVIMEHLDALEAEVKRLRADVDDLKRDREP